MASGSENLDEESFIPTFFVRALYDYQSNDPSSLSFYRDDIFQVLTRLDTGWWDGILGGERGWFPSNYVAVMSAQEVEANLGHIETYSSEATDAEIDMAAAMGSTAEVDNRAPAVADSSADFWVPHITAEGQVFYVNPQTGEQVDDISFHEGDISDSDISGSYPDGLHSILNSKGITPTQDNPNPMEYAGFGVPKRSNTPEPWVRCLADDGLAYYYTNKETGERQWTLPVSPKQNSNPGLLASVSSTTSSSDVSANKDKHANHHPVRKLPQPATSSTSTHGKNSSVTALQRSIAEAKMHGRVQLNANEQAAQALQEAMTVPITESLSTLTTDAQQSVTAILACIRRQSDRGSPQQIADLNTCVSDAVLAVRDLLYVTVLPSGTLPAEKAQEASEAQRAQALLKPSQRKVTATLSKLVLSTCTYGSDMQSTPDSTTESLEREIFELEFALQTFVTEVQRTRRQSRLNTKRIYGTFSPDHLGLGIYGGGAAASWKGFGFVALIAEEDVPKRGLEVDAIQWLKRSFNQLSVQLDAFSALLQNPSGISDAKGLASACEIIRGFTAFLRFVADLHIAKHVDIDGFEEDADQSSEHLAYMQTVFDARELVRMLEATTQAIYDDNVCLLSAAQSLQPPDSVDHDTSCRRLDALVGSLRSNSITVLKTMEELLRLGQGQSELAGGEYTLSINNRMSKILTIEGTMRHSIDKRPNDFGYDDIVDMEGVLSGYSPNERGQQFALSVDERKANEESPSSADGESTATSEWKDSSTSSLVESEVTTLDTVVDEVDSPVVDDEDMKRKTVKKDLFKHLGGVPQALAEPEKPHHLRPDYKDEEMIMDLDGTVKAASVGALIERLTAHDILDTKLIDTFMMNWKLFVNPDMLVEGLIKRFRMQPPEGLEPSVIEDWRRQKLDVVRTRVLSRIKTLVQDEDDVLDAEDRHIFGTLKAFLSSDDISQVPYTRRCLATVERAEAGDDVKRVPVNTAQPPQSIIPKNINKKLKLMDIDPLEMARQLTILDFRLFIKVQPMECILRGRGQKSSKADHIAPLIQSTNLIATWVADCILSKEDSRRRATVIKYFINVADRCLFLRNFNSMAALLAGLGQTAIRRLNRTWEQVNQRSMQLLEVIEWTMDPAKNRKNYNAALAQSQSPCVPFFGFYLSQLTFIHDGNPDMVNGLVNFSKHQRTAEVMNEMKRWQNKAHSLQPIKGVLSYVEDSLSHYADHIESYKDHLWNLSLEREPREREDEKMARLLQESGFL